MRVSGLACLLAGVLLTLASCKRDAKIVMPTVVGEYKDTAVSPPVDTSTVPPALVISFTAIANTKTLVPEAKTYSNTSQDVYLVTKLNFYISNVMLQKQDGSWYTEPESYHLIKYVDAKRSFTISNLPEGNYKAMKFLIGVDSLRNVSGSQTGDLAQNQDMFWDWNTGYIFFKLEGAFSSSVSPMQDFAIHVGGFEGPNSCLQSVTMNLPSDIVAKKGRVSYLRNNVVLDEIFTKPMEIGFDYYYKEIIKGPKIFRDISINYADMFVPVEVRN